MRALAATLLALGVLAAPAAAAPTAPPWQAAQRMQDLAFDAQSALLLDEHRDEVSTLIEQGKDAFAKANPAYEQMEGVVAGVPSLADYDVIIDAGSDGSDPENADPFDLETPAGR